MIQQIPKEIRWSSQLLCSSPGPNTATWAGWAVLLQQWRWMSEIWLGRIVYTGLPLSKPHLKLQFHTRVSFILPKGNTVKKLPFFPLFWVIFVESEWKKFKIGRCINPLRTTLIQRLCKKMQRESLPELRFKSDLSEHLFRKYRKLLKATQWEQRAKIAHRYIFKGKPLQWCLGVQAFACTTWKRSTCCCLCQTEMFPLMYQFYHTDFPISLRAEHQHYCRALHLGKGQLVDCLAKQLLVSFSNKTC